MVERHGHDGGGAEGARHRLGRRGDRPGADVRSHRRTPRSPQARCRWSSTSSPSAGRSIPAAVEAAITPRTRAIMPVHLGQQMCDMDAPDRDRRPPRPGDRRGLRARARAAVERPRRRIDRRVRLVQPPVEQGADGGRGRHAADQRRRRWPAARTRSSTAGGRRTPTSASTRSAANYRLGELNCALLCTQLDRYEEQRAERERGARLFEELAAGLTGVRLNTIDPRITRWGFYRYLFAIDPDEFAGAGNEAIVDGARGRGHPRRAPVPADEPLRPVPAEAVAAAGVRRARGARWIRRGGRSRSPRRRASAAPST